MLVLLIIVMVASPVIARRGLTVSLPKTEKADAVKPGDLRVVLGKDLSVELDGKPMSREDFGLAIKGLAARDPGLRVAVAADESVKWGDLAALLDDIKHAGVKRVAAEVGSRGAR
ncbi:MAG: biopolymer transporter ExbD [Elusimicrobiota bacterium]|nr:MAG: biopolymer transporter ExbD [Elusimicrobiota bacterium]